jgi:hypothetical protein
MGTTNLIALNRLFDHRTGTKGKKRERKGSMREKLEDEKKKRKRTVS